MCVLRRALAEVHIAGVSSNVGFLQALVATRDFETNNVTTTFIEDNMVLLCDPRAAGVQSERAPPVASQTIESSASCHHQQLPAGSITVTSPIRGRVCRLAVQVNGQIAAGSSVCVVFLAPNQKTLLILLLQLCSREHEDGAGAICTPGLRLAAVVCDCGRCCD